MSETPEEMDMERMLRQLRPLAPNPEVRERVAADLRLDDSWLPRQVRRAPRWLAAAGWASLGAAAAVTVLSVLQPRTVQTNADGLVKSSLDEIKQQALTSNAMELQASHGRVWSVEKRAWMEARQVETPIETPAATAPEPRSRAVLPVNFQ